MLNSFIAFDVETTGLSPLRGHRVIEIGAVSMIDRTLGEEFHSLINCDRSITKAVQRIHGITKDMLQGEPFAEAVFRAFRRFISNAVLVAHNAPFDRSFLRSEFSRLGWGVQNRVLCTLKKSRISLPELPNHRLKTVARHLLGELPPANRPHRALDDARLTARVWLALETS